MPLSQGSATTMIITTPWVPVVVLLPTPAPPSATPISPRPRSRWGAWPWPWPWPHAGTRVHLPIAHMLEAAALTMPARQAGRQGNRGLLGQWLGNRGLLGQSLGLLLSLLLTDSSSSHHVHRLKGFESYGGDLGLSVVDPHGGHQRFMWASMVCGVHACM